MRSWCAAALWLTALAATAGAQPAASTLKDWEQVPTEGVEVFVRGDGARIEVAPASLPCFDQLRLAEAPRPEGLSRTFWPVAEPVGDGLVLCVESPRGPVAVTARPAAPGGLSTLFVTLDELAAQISPPIETASLPMIASPWPLLTVAGDDFTVKVDDGTVAVGLVHAAQGACSNEHLASVRSRGMPAAETPARGYYPTLVRGDDEHFACFDTTEGYVTVVIEPASATPRLDELLTEIREQGQRRYGPPSVRARVGDGEDLPWKQVKGERFGVARGQVLVSTARLGAEHTRYAIGMGRDGCSGTVHAPDAVADPLFPDEVGPVWIDPAPGPRWRIWACIALRRSGEQVELSVIGPVGVDGPPTGAGEVAAIRLAVGEVARAYGLTVDGGAGARPFERRKRRGGSAWMAGAYGGAITFGPPDPDDNRRYGGLVGAHLRSAETEGFGLATALDFELGFGAGEVIGEVRVGAGVSAGLGGLILQVMGGASIGSTGPASAIDLFGEAGVLLPAGRSMTSLSMMRAIGVGGPDHDRVQLWFAPPGQVLPSVNDNADRSQVTFMFGARYLGYPDGGGDALLLTLGFGLSGADRPSSLSTPPVP